MKNQQVNVIGLGCIGLPIACSLTSAGYKVLGIDCNDQVLHDIANKENFHHEPGLQSLIEQAIDNKLLKLSKHVLPADIHIIAVPTCSKLDNTPDISRLLTVIDAIEPHLENDNLVIIESTSPIGTTDYIGEKLRKHLPQLHVAYCPERVLPSNILIEMKTLPRIIGGIDSQSTERALSFYCSFVEGSLIATNAKTAETVKLAENTYRDINIAFANELSMITDKIDVDVFEVIRLANYHPRVNILSPGPGVGGRCLTMAPLYLASANPDDALIIPSARKVNNNKPDWVTEKIRREMQHYDLNSIACLGLTYKPNVADTRKSVAMEICHTLEKEFTVFPVDPFIPDTHSLESAIKNSDLIVILVAHTVFSQIPQHLLNNHHILDFVGITNKSHNNKFQNEISHPIFC